MPQTYSPCPRPILKRASTTPREREYLSSITRDESGQLLAIDPSILSPLVRFPPSPTLTHTFTAYSPSTYDRSPIVVSPNQCSLPERGCPGRTYMPGSSSSHRAPTRSHSGKHLHPRARLDIQPEEDEEDTDPTPKATPTAYHRPLPPLVPDLSSSSSSESEESEGVLPDFSALCISPVQSSLLPHPRSPSVPSPPSSPNSPSNKDSRRRQLSPSRPKRTRGHRPHTSHPDAADVDVVVSPHEPQPRYKTFSENSMLTSCALPVPDVGCFGGF